jgi:putative restriction endonuclease
MKFYLGVTDNKWFRYLSGINPEDVNFWQPGGTSNFKAILPDSPFIFKLKYPVNAIGGVGFFSHYTTLPLSMAWDIFGDRNGTSSFVELQQLIRNYRVDKLNHNPTVGCIVLTNPIFFDPEDWIPVPPNWSKSIVQGKTYSTDEIIGNGLWELIYQKLEKYFDRNGVNAIATYAAEPELRYGYSILKRVRLGQGAFRVLVTDSYIRKCSISGEKTLPVLEAAHIRPYAEEGPHAISNGILLRSDLHKLFDGGYITITKDYKVEVSRRIKEEFENGRDYYKFHGNPVLFLPKDDFNKPAAVHLEWHNINRYNG